MAQIGSFVPAQGAQVGLLDHIFTRILTRDSTSLSLSSFAVDLHQVNNHHYTISLTIIVSFQISKALKQSTERSLIILDEFGKGTNSASHNFLLSFLNLIVCFLSRLMVFHF